MKISIAMATYNGAKYLQEQLDSFVAQTRQPDELVVCDDRSTDDTVEILNRFAKTTPFTVRIFVNEENLGYGQNFGLALSLCAGDLIFLSDQDDVWFEEKIETIQELAIKNKYIQLFMNDAELVHHDLSSTGLTKQGQIRSAVLSESSFVMGCCMAIRRDFLQRALPIPMSCKGHDVWISKLAEGLQQRHVTPQILQYYRRHENNESKFVSNKTHRVNMTNAFSNRLHKIFENRSIDAHSNDLTEALSFANEMILFLTTWANETDDQELKNKIKKFSDSQKKRCQVLRSRLQIRSASTIKRIFLGFNFYRKGGYKEFRGFLSYAKDIIA